ncbi:hypothetical protein HanHA300_Chr16g0622071 [Helianthus annuus]|nr:hypothetical protein HanHA300_Chr16g0622071 [Helianthus annuus]KAJ0461501.1 hypothetical protein HanHA89_Chr16g0672961 [Helianthus annuus]KAJ0645798.1 hypothetical protein HanOQP8_Chr16g0627931 [Helianthus annuus]KAJ0822355.1 hypothetical protein HanPSC8_Chr16g0731021 [Helianthus annuus]
MCRSWTVNHCITGRIRLITGGIRRPGRGCISNRSNCLTYRASDCFGSWWKSQRCPAIGAVDQHVHCWKVAFRISALT